MVTDVDVLPPAVPLNIPYLLYDSLEVGIDQLAGRAKLKAEHLVQLLVKFAESGPMLGSIREFDIVGLGEGAGDNTLPGEYE